MATKFIQAPEAYVVTAIGTTETQITVSDFKTISGVTINQSMIGSSSDYIPLTISAKTDRAEQVLAKVNSVSGNNVVLDIIRAVNPVSPYNAGGGVARPHNVNDTVIISDNPALLNKLTAKDNDEVVTGQWSFPTPTGASSPATKQYADGLVALGAPEATVTARGIAKLSASPNLTIGTATITIATPAVVSFTAHGLVVGDSIQFTTTGALPTGIVANTTYFVIASGFGVNSFQISATITGTALATSGTQSGVHTLVRVTPIAVGYNDTTKLPTTAEKLALAGGGNFGAPGAGNKFVTEAYNASASGLPVVRKYEVGTWDNYGAATSRFTITNTSGSTWRYTWDGFGIDPLINATNYPIGGVVSLRTINFAANNIGQYFITGSGLNYFEVSKAAGTVESLKQLSTNGSIYVNKVPFVWTKPANLKYITVKGVGGGAGCDSSTEGAGGGGGYFEKMIPAASLGATETLVIGFSAPSYPNGNSTYRAGNTLFGSICVAYGAIDQTGGTATGGDINIKGQEAVYGSTGTGGNYPISGGSMLGLGAVGNGSTPSGYGVGATETTPATAGVIILTEYYS